MTSPPKRPDSRSARQGRAPDEIGDWVLHADLGVLRRDGQEVRLNDKTLHVLLVLLDAEEGGVSRDALLDAVWGESYPSDGVVSRAIADLRSALGEKAGEQRYIRTLPKFGYQLLRPGQTVDGQPRDKRFMFGAAVILLIAAATWYVTQDREERPGYTLRLPPPAPLTSAPGLEHQPRQVPDSDWVVYAALRAGRADWDLFRVSVSDGVSQAVASRPEVSEHGPAVSPAGDEVAYVRYTPRECNVVVQSLTLGVPKVLAACTTRFATLVDWSPDGTHIAYTGAESEDEHGYRRLHMVDTSGDESQRLSTAVSPTGSDYYPRFSPDGRYVAFMRGEPQPDHRSTLWIVDVESGAEQQQTLQPTQLGGMTWLDDRTILFGFFDSGSIEMHTVDIQSGDLMRYEEIGFIHPDYSIANDTLIVAEQNSARGLRLLRAGKTKTVAQSTSDDHHGSLSPSESWIAFVSRRSGHDEIWLAEPGGEATRRLTRFDGATLRYPDWHPDEKRILFTAQTTAKERIHEVDVVTGAIRVIDSAADAVTTPRWMPDGETIVYACRHGGVWGICRLAEGSEIRIADGFFRPAPLSPDAVAVVDEGGAFYRLSIDEGSAQKLIDQLPGDGRYGWASDGVSLVYIAAGEAGGEGRLIRAKIDGSDPELLFTGKMPLSDTSISLGARSGAILFTAFESASDDLVLFEGIDVRR